MAKSEKILHQIANGERFLITGDVREAIRERLVMEKKVIDVIETGLEIAQALADQNDELTGRVLEAQFDAEQTKKELSEALKELHSIQEEYAWAEERANEAEDRLARIRSVLNATEEDIDQCCLDQDAA